MPPFKEEVVYCFANVGWSVCWQTKWFLLIILNTIYHRVFIFHMQIGNDQQMTPIDFGVTRSKVRGHMCRSTFLVERFSQPLPSQKGRRRLIVISSDTKLPHTDQDAAFQRPIISYFYSEAIKSCLNLTIFLRIEKY